MKTIERNSPLVAFASKEVNNKNLKIIKFIFVDDQPNDNKMLVPYEEFASLKDTAVHMPIKMRFLGAMAGAGNHIGAIPVGHITDIEEEEEDGVHRLIADGVIYASEFPDIVEWLEDKFEKDEAPGISFEIGYKDDIIQKGIRIIKGLTAQAAAIVRNPAYGKRTALLALASNQTLTDDEIEREVETLFSKEPKGGTNNVDLEQALERIKELEKELADKDSKVEELTAVASKVETLETELADLTEKVTTYEFNSLVAERTQKVAAAGLTLDTDAAELAKKQKAWASMSEEIFEVFVSGIASAAKKSSGEKTALASAGLTLPKITPSVTTGNPTSYSDLRTKMKSLNGRIASTEEE